MQKHPQNQSNVGSSGQRLTTNVSLTLCDWQICHQTRVLCGCTTFGTELQLGPKLIHSLRLCSLDKGVAITRGVHQQHSIGDVWLAMRLSACGQAALVICFSVVDCPAFKANAFLHLRLFLFL